LTEVALASGLASFLGASQAVHSLAPAAFSRVHTLQIQDPLTLPGTFLTFLESIL
jgi:hypothetical protein